jgi:hypothetical protein
MGLSIPNAPQVGFIQMGPSFNSYYSWERPGNFDQPAIATYLVPEGVTAVGITIAGGGSGASFNVAAVSVYTLTVNEGDIIETWTGGAGRNILNGGGWPDGGHGGLNTITGYYGFGGGGSSRVYLNGVLVIVQGGMAGGLATYDPATIDLTNNYTLSGLSVVGGRHGLQFSTYPETSLIGDGEDGRSYPQGASALSTGKGASYDGGVGGSGGAAGSGGTVPATAGSFLQGGNGAEIAANWSSSSFRPNGPGGGGGGYYGGGGGGIDPSVTGTHYPSGARGSGGGGTSWHDTSVVTWRTTGSASYNGQQEEMEPGPQGYVNLWHPTTIGQLWERWGGGPIQPTEDTQENVLDQFVGWFGIPWYPL